MGDQTAGRLLVGHKASPVKSTKPEIQDTADQATGRQGVDGQSGQRSRFKIAHGFLAIGQRIIEVAGTAAGNRLRNGPHGNAHT